MTGLHTKLKKTLLIAGALTFGGLAVGATGQAAYASKGNLMSVNPSDKTQAPLVVTLGKAEIIALPEGVSDVLVANPSIVDVQAVKSNRLYAVGLNIGDTNIIVLDAGGNVVKRIDVHVSYDLQAIQSLIERLFPNESVKVGSVHDQILLTGRVSTPEVAAKVSSLVGHYVSDLQDESGATDQLVANLLEVQGDQQVMLQVRIVEAERSVIKELGVDFNVNDPDELASSTIFGELPLGSTLDNNGIDALRFGGSGALSLSQDPVGVSRTFFDTGLDGIGIIGLMLEALEEENLVNVLAEPNLTAVSGQQAGFLAGGEFPVPTGRDQFGNITIEFREFGVSLNFRPTVLSDERISLQMNTEVSSLDSSNAVVLADLTVPGLDIRRAETTIEIPSGGSLMIAGLLQSEATNNMKGLPGIRNTPVLGDLISSESFSRNETELVVIVTAYKVEPFASKAKAEKRPLKKQAELTKIFAKNIRRHYDVNENEIAQVGAFGYIVD